MPRLSRAQQRVAAAAEVRRGEVAGAPALEDAPAAATGAAENAAAPRQPADARPQLSRWLEEFNRVCAAEAASAAR
jgi:hypothetical protein